MKAPLVIVFAAMTYAAFPSASYGEPSSSPDQQAGHQVQSHQGSGHSQSGHGQAHGAEEEHHDADAAHGAHAEHHAHKEAFLFRVREAYLRKRGELRLGLDFGYLRGKEKLEIYRISGFGKKHKHKERIRYGDFEYLLKIDYGITDRLQVTGIVPYFSIREHIGGEPFFGNEPGDIFKLIR